MPGVSAARHSTHVQLAGGKEAAYPMVVYQPDEKDDERQRPEDFRHVHQRIGQ